MGITIHYSGIFRSDASLSEMIDEASAFARLNNWEFHVFETSFDTLAPVDSDPEKTLYGLVINPPNCESISLFFNIDRQLGFYTDPKDFRSEIWVVDEKTGEGEWVPDPEAEKLQPGWSAFTKTAYAGKEIHKKVVALLRQISEKYFSNFEVVDEAGYWETGDDKSLDDVFGIDEKSLR